MPQYFGILFNVDLRCSGDKCQEKVYRQLIRQTRPPKCCREFYFSDIFLMCCLLLPGSNISGNISSKQLPLPEGPQAFLMVHSLDSPMAISQFRTNTVVPTVLLSSPLLSEDMPRDQPFILHYSLLQSILIQTSSAFMFF